MRECLLALLLLQMPIQPGRSTAPARNIYPYALSGINLTCSVTPCAQTSGTVSPGSGIPVTGVITFAATNDATISVGGVAGGAVNGQTQFTCDGGSSWTAIAVGNMSVGGSPSIVYPAPNCPAPANSNQIQFRSIMNGGNGGGAYSASWQAPSSVTFTW